MNDTEDGAPQDEVGALARVMLDRFANSRPHWDWSGPVEEELEEWRDFYRFVDEVRSTASRETIRALVDHIRFLDLDQRDDDGHLKHAAVLRIQATACFAIAENLLVEGQSEGDARLAEAILETRPPEGWVAGYFDLLAEAFDDQGDLGLAKDLARRTYMLARREDAGRRELRSLRSLREILTHTTDEEAVPEISGELPDILTALHVAALLQITVRTARRRMTEGTIPSRKFGRQRYTRKEEFLGLFEPERS